MATITVQELATDLGTDARTARKFLRSVTPADAQPGKGSRWAIEKRDVRSLKSKFSKFEAAAAQAKLEKSIIEVDGVKVAEVTHTEIDEPTDEMLAELEAEGIDLD